MGGLCRSSPQVQTTTQTYRADPRVARTGERALGMAEEAASQPFQMPAAPVAEFTPFQQQTFNQYLGIQGGTDPYFQQAKAGMTEAGTPVTQSQIASYMNPFADASMAAMKKYIFDPQRRDTMGRATQLAGGVGADRLALTSQNLDKTQADALNSAMAGFYLPAMQQAQRAKEMAMASGQGWANLGLGEQGARLQATGALGGAGTQQQALEQAKLMSPYQQTLARIAYPFQTAQYLSGITGDMSNVFKGTQSGTTTTTPSQPSMFNQIAGLGMAGAGLMMGNPFMAMGGIGTAGFGGASPSYMAGGYNPAFNAPSYPNPYGGSWYGNRGGAVDRAEGGSVDPYDVGEGYQEGGFSEDPFGARFEGPTANENVDERFTGAQYVGGGFPDYTQNAALLRDYGLSRIPPGQSPTEDVLPVRPVPTKPVMRTGYMVPVQPQQKPQITVNPSRPSPTQAEPPSQLPQRPPQERPEPDPSINGEITPSGLFVPRSALPYPDAADRDWGQRLTRSPWMSLVSAGAKMMQSTKGGLGGLGEGIESGAKTLEEQRKDLRSEQAINMKAEELMRKAERDLAMEKLAEKRIEQGKYTWSGGTDIDPTTNQPVPGIYRLPTTGTEEPRFYPGRTMTGRGAGSRPTAYEIKKQDWLKLNPGDEQGAVDFASGRRVMTEAQIANASAMRAQQDANNNPMLFGAEQRQTYLDERIEYWKKFYREHNSIR